MGQKDHFVRIRPHSIGIVLLLLLPAIGRGEPSISGASVWNERGIEHYRGGDFREAVKCFDTAQSNPITVRIRLKIPHMGLKIIEKRNPTTRIDSVVGMKLIFFKRLDSFSPRVSSTATRKPRKF